METSLASSTADSDSPGRWVLASTILASSMAFIDGTALSVALPVIQEDLNATGAELLWIVDSYLVMLAALILIGGSMGDKIGRKKVFMAGIALFSLASLACGLSPDANFLIAMRVLQGIGGAFMIPGSLAIITAYFGRDRRGQAIGTWSAVTTIVVVGGPFLGGLLANTGFWRGIFLINLPLAAITLIILYLKTPESRDEDHGPLDFKGAAQVFLGLAFLVYGFISAPEYGFSSVRIYGALIAGAVFIALFVLTESRSKHPMVPLSIFKARAFSGANLLTLFLYGGLSVAFFFYPLNLVQVQGYNPFQAGLSFLPFTFLLAGMSRWAGGLVDRIGPRLPLVVGPMAAGGGFILLAIPGITGGPADYWRSFMPGIICFGVGMGITVAPLTTTVMSALPQRFAGTASGVNNAVSRSAGVLAIAIMGSAALQFFAWQLEVNTQDVNLSPPVRQALREEADRFGEASVPAEVDPQKVPEVNKAIKESFVQTYRLVMSICAIMAGISVVMTLLLIRGLPGKKRTA